MILCIQDPEKAEKMFNYFPLLVSFQGEELLQILTNDAFCILVGRGCNYFNYY